LFPIKAIDEQTIGRIEADREGGRGPVLIMSSHGDPVRSRRPLVPNRVTPPGVSALDQVTGGCAALLAVDETHLE
jgi:hypothetical protein